MSEQQLICQNDQRRAQVRAKCRNGIDFIEVEMGAERQPILHLYFLQKAPKGLQKENIRITGGRRIRNLRVEAIYIQKNKDREEDDVVCVKLCHPGDSSTYRLCLVKLDSNGKATNETLDDFDPRYSCLDFNFNADGVSDLDCLSTASCQSGNDTTFARGEPEINYLAKDYASFRQLILDRLALLMPNWNERHVPDLGITLVELLAYVGDYLSYFQDAVATEAYLDTARQRISLRRHARLVDYALHEGCNARTWVCVQVDNPVTFDPTDAYFVTGFRNAKTASTTVLSEEQLRQIPSSQYDVFESMIQEKIQLHQAHNKLCFYTWGDTECCLPKGATRATLCYKWQSQTSTTAGSETEQTSSRKTNRKSPKQASMETTPEEQIALKQGEVLIFEEIIGPRTGNPADADPRHRHAVRLTNVKCSVDDLCGVQLVEIEWAEEDALPFALCISAVAGPNCERTTNISVARGNAILVDHGRSVREEKPLTVPQPVSLARGCEGEGRSKAPLVRPARFEPLLTYTPLTHAAPLPVEDPTTDPSSLLPASTLLKQDVQLALPLIRLVQQSGEASDPDRLLWQEVLGKCADGKTKSFCWEPRQELLSSGPDDQHFVAEIDNSGLAHLRFGNDELGRHPQPDEQFAVYYRIGSGQAGNVGAGAIAQIVYRQQMVAGVSDVRNPLPAQGGVDAQPMAEAKLYAPHAFRHQLQRAVTASDYARLAERNAKVQSAAGTLRWNGSWYTAQVTIDPFAQQGDAQALSTEVAHALAKYRRIGHDMEVLPARYVSIELAVNVCVKPHFQRGHVKSALLERFSNRRLHDGKVGFFHPDNLTFGKPIYLSEVVAVAQAVPGVESVEVTTLKRQHETSDVEALQILQKGVLQLGALEVAQLDNDPAEPESGKLTLTLGGGR